MSKVFLYLYPIEEYTRMFLFRDDGLYDLLGIKRPLPVLNATIKKRYREKGYKVIFALYPDKTLYGVEKQLEDRIIYADIPFSEASAFDEDGNIKQDFTPKYPNELNLIGQIGDVDELVVGGYHSGDCVKRVAEIALENGINALVDLDLTELFFNLYKRDDYFDMEAYSPERFKTHIVGQEGIEENRKPVEDAFNRTYSSPVYGFFSKSYMK